MSILEPSPNPDPPALEPAITTRHLGKRFGDTWAVRDLDLDIPPGEFFGFLGPNGSGKSTTINLLTTMLLPTEGRMAVAGHDVLAAPLEVKRVIGVLPEEIHTYERLTVEELVDFSGRIRGLPRAEVTRRGRELLDLLELAATDRRKLLVDCSMGMRKKVVLTCALLHRPRVLFLDEPFNGIDARTSLTIRRILARLVTTGTTVFFSSHILEIVEKLCSRIAILDQGRLRAVGTRDELAGQAGLPAGTDLAEVFLTLVEDPGAAEADLSWLDSSSS
ncbi:MAG: ABC transporter ATP-binding protein [Planctomycetota bacterium]